MTASCGTTFHGINIHQHPSTSALRLIGLITWRAISCSHPITYQGLYQPRSQALLNPITEDHRCAVTCSHRAAKDSHTDLPNMDTAEQEVGGPSSL